MSERHTDAAAVPDAGDDTLRKQLAEALTPLCDLPRIQHTDGNPGPCLHDLARADALLPRIREHVAIREQAVRAYEREQFKIEGDLYENVKQRADAAEAERERADTHFEWGVKNHDGYIGMHATEASARQSYADMSDYMFPHQAVVRRAVTTIRGEWEAATDG